jgi:hypothetical protein
MAKPRIAILGGGMAALIATFEITCDPPRSAHGYAQRQADRVHKPAIGWLTRYTSGLWPAASPRRRSATTGSSTSGATICRADLAAVPWARFTAAARSHRAGNAARSG